MHQPANMSIGWRELVDAASDQRFSAGPIFEPILAMIPSHDRIGQIRGYTRWLAKPSGRHDPRVLGARAGLGSNRSPAILVDAGIEYTVLDDFHFKCAGLDRAAACTATC